MSGWKPIASAPFQIGRPLLLYPRPANAQGSSYSTVFEGYWDGDGWQTSRATACYPTHWMPMPPPPLTIVQPRA
jgi:Protein of unknown function (DUF551)